MLEYKPNGGYNGDGFNHKKTKNASRRRRYQLQSLLFYILIFTFTANIFGWWSIPVDIAILFFFGWIVLTLQKRIKKLDKVV